MQIMIDISEVMYKRIKGLASVGCFDHNMTGHVMCAIATGTPLSKGHGRLIDADELLNTDRLIVDSMKCHYIPMMDVYDAETIIPADKEE